MLFRSVKLEWNIMPDGAFDPEVDVESYSSLDDECITVKPDGTIIAKKAGSAPISVYGTIYKSRISDPDDGEYIATCNVTVENEGEYIPVDTVELKTEDEQTEYPLDAQVKLIGTVLPAAATDQEIKYSVKEKSKDIASVDENTGDITIKSIGQATFIAKSADGPEAELTLTFKKPVVQVSAKSFFY